jgi:nitroimidazol reductase NimA-like FMN-containing flavoprotein (pyridoxamine 5'-phosphate oxidase superfamily)
VRRRPQRGAYDRPTIDAILDEGLIAHLGFVHTDQPFVIPTLFARVHDHVYVHGSSASRTLLTLGGGVPVCLTVTLLDGLVLARSAFHHSANYRSVVLLGTASPVDDPEEKLAALQAITEHVVPGRWADVRPPTRKELKATSVLSLPIDEASAKVRVGPPIDDEPDYALDTWAGVIPLRLEALPAEPDPRLRPGVVAPSYASDWQTERASRPRAH